MTAGRPITLFCPSCKSAPGEPCSPGCEGLLPMDPGRIWLVDEPEGAWVVLTDEGLDRIVSVHPDELTARRAAMTAPRTSVSEPYVLHMAWGESLADANRRAGEPR